MRILLIDVYHYNKGGAETVCFNTGAMLEEQGHQVVYFTLNGIIIFHQNMKNIFLSPKKLAREFFVNSSI